MAKNRKSTHDPAGAGQPPHLPEVDQIDLGAALPPGPPPKRGRGRPRSAAPKPPNPNRKIRKDKGIKKNPKTPYIDNNILLDNNKIIKVGDIGNSDNGEFKTAIDLKSLITQKEARFLDLYVSGDYTIEKAMIKAGYEGCSQRALYYIASKICNKVELQAEDHKKLFREMGAGEHLVIKTLLSLLKSKSEKIKLGAVSQLAKILDLTKEQLEGAGGVTIIFEGSGTPGATASLPGAPGAPPLPPSQGEIKVIPTSTKPMMITK